MVQINNGNDANNSYNTIKSAVQTTSYEDLDEGTKDAAEAVLSYYRSEVASQIQSFDALFQKDAKAKHSSLLNNFKTTQQKHDFQSAQNESTKVAFLERYLFLIIKILLFLICICIFLYVVREQLSFGQTFTSLQNQASLFKKQTNDSINQMVSQPSTNQANTLK